jgi:hypothetical protein
VHGLDYRTAFDIPEVFGNKFQAVAVILITKALQVLKTLNFSRICRQKKPLIDRGLILIKSKYYAVKYFPAESVAI